jgi:hypothetical protein
MIDGYAFLVASYFTVNCKNTGSTHQVTVNKANEAKQGNVVAAIEAVEDLEVSIFLSSLFFFLLNVVLGIPLDCGYFDNT